MLVSVIVFAYVLLSSTLQISQDPSDDIKDHHVCALFHLKPSVHGAKPQFKRSKNDHLLYICVLLLMRSSDCESNPGPRPPPPNIPAKCVVNRADGVNVLSPVTIAICGTTQTA